MDDFEVRIEKMGRAIKPYAKAKAERVYIEQYRKSLKAIIMGESDKTTATAREQDAYADPRYLKLLEGLREAVKEDETCRWALEKFKIEFEHWRTLQANNRFLDKGLT